MSIRLPRNAQIWLPGYVRSRAAQWFGPASGEQSPLVWIAICDHYEPFWRNTDEELAQRRVELWRTKWPEIASRNRDSTGQPAQYTFFYPEEEYRPHLLERLAEMARMGLGDVEVHIHHDGEGEQNFVDRMSRFLEALDRRHGLLRKQDGKYQFGFIHGNWALDNSHPERRHCGLNNEITLLKNLGCYADFTMPSGASPTQGRMVNVIYWASDDPEQPKSYDTGVPVTIGAKLDADLLMIPGPLGLRWQERLLPRMETGELAGHDLPTPYRITRWLDLSPRIGRHIFIKLYTHGTQERNSGPLLEGGLDRAFSLLAAECERRNCQARYVTAWQLRQAVEALRLGQEPIIRRASPVVRSFDPR